MKNSAKGIAITLGEMLSEPAQEAIDLADYVLRKNARYRGWSGERKVRYRYEKAFAAIVAARVAEEPAVGVTPP